MSAAFAAAPAPVPSTRTPIRVMVVDDSVVVRGLVARWLSLETDIAVVASLRNGREAVEQVERASPDVVILDIEMPELDGLAALPLLLQKKPDLIVIMASALTRRHAETSLRALSLGAADYIPKPDSNSGITTSAEFRRELVDKIRQLGGRRTRRHSEKSSVPHDGGRSSAAIEMRSGNADPVFPSVTRSAFKLRTWSARPPRVLLVGSSTGGPQALNVLLSGLATVIKVAPVLITQHMPPTFTTILGEHLTRASGCAAREAEDGEAVLPGRIYLAPGGRHMLIARRNSQPVVVLDDGPPVNFCKPAVDPLFESASQVFGNSALAVILTGMGSDGTRGAEDIVAHGGNVLAQDESTSVVWGMPGSAVNAGVCAAVLPLERMASQIVRLFEGDFRDAK